MLKKLYSSRIYNKYSLVYNMISTVATNKYQEKIIERKKSAFFCFSKEVPNNPRSNYLWYYCLYIQAMNVYLPRISPVQLWTHASPMSPIQTVIYYFSLVNILYKLPLIRCIKQGDPFRPF